MAARDRLTQFARNRPEPSDGRMSVVAAATGQAGRLLDFVEIAMRDFESARSSWSALQDEFNASIRAAGEGVVHRLSDDETSVFERKREAHVEVEFRIDSFFLFGRILLDRIVVLIDLALLRTATTLGGSHSNLERLLARRCDELGIEFPEALRSQIEDLSARITDFRDHYVVHLKSPRATRALAFERDMSRVYSSVGWMNPKDTDDYVTSADPHDLHDALLAYVESVIEFLEANESRRAP